MGRPGIVPAVALAIVCCASLARAQAGPTGSRVPLEEPDAPPPVAPPPPIAPPPYPPTIAPPPYPPAPASPAPAPARAAERPRLVGLQLSLAPSLVVDVQYRLFYAFAAGSYLFPALSGGELLAFAFGAGVSLPMSSATRWTLDFFASATPARVDVDGVFTGLGVGLGFHVTYPSGLTLGFKAPAIGYAVGQHTTRAYDGFLRYYVSSAMGLPLISLGYRF